VTVTEYRSPRCALKVRVLDMPTPQFDESVNSPEAVEIRVADAICQHLIERCQNLKLLTRRRIISDDIRREIVLVRSTFGEVLFNEDTRTLSVRTPPVSSRAITLGRFEICLYWERIGATDAYRAVALEPKPARANRLVTHPHVFDERLCEGSAAPLIQEALIAGRLCEFFSFVNQLLTGYSPGRCYVEPEDWHLPACIDCADIVRLTAARCRSCDEVLCPACGSNCPWCGAFTCFQCAHQCAVCKRRFCWDCLEFCLFCDQAVCPSCRVGSTCLTCNQGD